MGIEAIVKPGYESLYIRSKWMKKLDEMKKQKKPFEKRRGKPK